MRPTESQSNRLFANMNMQKFRDIKQLSINDLKLFPLIDQTGTQLLTSIIS